jgi:hypothetical protein
MASNGLKKTSHIDFLPHKLNKYYCVEIDNSVFFPQLHSRDGRKYYQINFNRENLPPSYVYTFCDVFGSDDFLSDLNEKGYLRENIINDIEEKYTTCIQISRNNRQERSVVF